MVLIDLKVMWCVQVCVLDSASEVNSRGRDPVVYVCLDLVTVVELHLPSTPPGGPVSAAPEVIYDFPVVRTITLSVRVRVHVRVISRIG